MKCGSLFSGIGGFDLAAEWMGWENVFHCEWNEFGRQVLKYYWPEAISYGDITKTDFTIHRGTIDILTGGFPCQPFSLAGKRKGTEDERHLWPEMLRAIREIQPPWVVGENVSGLVNWDGGLVFDQVQTDLEAEGYEVIPFLLPACSVNAPHKRERVWFIAHSNGSRSKESTLQQSDIHTESSRINKITSDTGLQRPEINEKQTARFEQCDKRSASNPPGIGLHQRGTGNNRPVENGPPDGFGTLCKEVTSNTSNTGLQRSKKHGSIGRIRKMRNKQFNGLFQSAWEKFPTQPPICSRNDGIPSGLVGITVPKHRNESIKAYGNAIVPQVVYQIFKAIEQYEIQKP